MGADDYRRVDELLLALSEARERAEQAATAFAQSGSPEKAQVLTRIEQDLLALHSEVSDAMYFTGRGKPFAEPELQLTLT